jgi:hypothetical protein
LSNYQIAKLPNWICANFAFLLKLSTTIILLSFLAQMFSREFYYVDYFLDSAAYAKNCVNKARPKMHCNGKCQLMKKIREQEKKDQESQEHSSVYKMQVFSSRSSFADGIFFLSDAYIQLYTRLITGSPVDRACSVFHPPNAIVSLFS